MFKVGDVVEWESQAGGYSKVKRGTVVEVIPPLGPSHVPGSGFSVRPHESYVVRVKRTLFWPRVKHLHLVKDSELDIES